MQHNARAGIVCLTGVTPVGRHVMVDAGQLNRNIVLENDVVFGSVNAARRHFDLAADALRRADRDWLARLVTRHVPLERWQEALEKGEDDIKVLVDIAA
jgi:glucose 1-dehydrogenase